MTILTLFNNLFNCPILLTGAFLKVSKIPDENIMIFTNPDIGRKIGQGAYKTEPVTNDNGQCYFEKTIGLYFHMKVFPRSGEMLDGYRDLFSRYGTDFSTRPSLTEVQFAFA